MRSSKSRKRSLNPFLSLSFIQITIYKHYIVAGGVVLKLPFLWSSLDKTIVVE